MNKKEKSRIAVYAIAAMVYIILFFAIPIRKTAASWIMFIFTVIAFAVAFYSSKLAFDGNECPKSKVYGVPIFKVGLWYLIAQLVLGIIVFIIAALTGVKGWIAVGISVILAGAVAIGIIATDNTRDVVEEIDEKTVREVKQIKKFKVNTAGLKDLTSDPQLKKVMENIAEEFKYSDPVSSEATEKLEAEIAADIESLRSIIASGDKSAVMTTTESIVAKLNERNRICKTSKII